MDDELPKYSAVDQYATSLRSRRRRNRIQLLAGVTALACLWFWTWTTPQPLRQSSNSLLSKQRLQDDYATCTSLRKTPQDPSGLRERNARYVDGQRPVLIRNATVWTGDPVPGTSAEDARAGKRYAWMNADVFVEFGLIKRVEAGIEEAGLEGEYEVFEAEGRMVTSGIVVCMLCERFRGMLPICLPFRTLFRHRSSFRTDFS